MKRKVLSKLLVSLITASMFLSSCGAQETTGKVENSQVEGKKETANNVEDSALIEDISWSWSVSDYELWQLMRSQGDVSTELFEGTIDYADGSQGKVKPGRVALAEKSATEMEVALEFRGQLYFRDIEILEHWGDGEPLTDEEVEALKQQNSSDTASDSGLYRFSEADAKGLKDFDWNLFNELLPTNRIYMERYSTDPSKVEGVNFFEVVGKDPRINGDWSELNSCFSSVYGEGEEGITRFTWDLLESYSKCFFLSQGWADYGYLHIEPYRSNTDSGMYGDILENTVRDDAKEAYEEYMNPTSRNNGSSVCSGMSHYYSGDYDYIAPEDEWKVPYWDKFISAWESRNSLREGWDSVSKERKNDMFGMRSTDSCYDTYVSEGLLEDDPQMKEAIGYGN